MKRKIGIALFIILNLVFICVMIAVVELSFRLIVIDLDQKGSLEVAKQITNDVLILLSVLSIFVFSTNYFLTKKIVSSKRPFLTSLISTITGIIIVIPFFLLEKKTFIDYPRRTARLHHFLNRQTITSVQIITKTDTIQVEEVGNMINDIGHAKHKHGIWKYPKTMKLILHKIDGSKDSIYTNGQLLWEYRGKFFSTEQNIIEQYL